MKVEGIELIRANLPLVSPFRTSFGTEHEREVLLLRVVTDHADGWAECVALVDPVYSSEYVQGAIDVLRRLFIPSLPAMTNINANSLGSHLARYHGHKMAKAALEMALLDAELKGKGISLKSEMGASRDRVPCGVSVGIMDSIPELLDAVEGYLAESYLRIKLKIEPGWDVAPVTCSLAAGEPPRSCIERNPRRVRSSARAGKAAQDVWPLLHAGRP